MTQPYTMTNAKGTLEFEVTDHIRGHYDPTDMIDRGLDVFSMFTKARNYQTDWGYDVPHVTLFFHIVYNGEKICKVRYRSQYPQDCIALAEAIVRKHEAGEPTPNGTWYIINVDELSVSHK